MEHSPKYETVKEFWVTHVWNEYRCRMAVEKGWITANEFTEITGIEY